jgi:protein SCO1
MEGGRHYTNRDNALTLAKVKKAKLQTGNGSGVSCMSRNVLWTVGGMVLGLVLIAALNLSKPYTFRGSLIDPPVPAADFTLTDPQGKDFSLSDTRGDVALIFFGYTTCPDVCPATLGEMKQIRERLGKNADDVRFLFVTVDPERDTPERLGQYVATFDPAIVGLTASEPELEKVWKDYGVYRAITQQDSAAGYLVDHTARIYLVDQDGNLRLTYSFGTPVDDILQDVRYLVKQKGS